MQEKCPNKRREDAHPIRHCGLSTQKSRSHTRNSAIDFPELTFLCLEQSDFAVDKYMHCTTTRSCIGSLRSLSATCCARKTSSRSEVLDRSRDCRDGILRTAASGAMSDHFGSSGPCTRPSASTAGSRRRLCFTSRSDCAWAVRTASSTSGVLPAGGSLRRTFRAKSSGSWRAVARMPITSMAGARMLYISSLVSVCIVDLETSIEAGDLVYSCRRRLAAIPPAARTDVMVLATVG